VIWQLALRNLGFRKLRTLFLLAGYGLGVAVMIVLLSVGDAMIAQASDEKLIGGGDVTVLPEGLDVEVMKTGGIGGMFFSIANARFLYQQLLASPRNAAQVRAVAPQIESKLLYVTLRDGREIPVRASGEIPDATRDVGGAAPLLRAAGRTTMVIAAGCRQTLPSCVTISITFICRRATLPVVKAGASGTISTFSRRTPNAGSSSHT
jgi:hypothetical protein